MNYSTVKYLIDKIFALFLIFFLSPLFIIISIAIYINMGNPIFFRQERIGFKNEKFQILKFRTMNDYSQVYKNDDKRITKLGNFLRKYSLDELPELINILKGEMSFVGPRPLLVSYLKLYSKTQIRRHLTKPGLTGLAQVKGRNLLSWDKRFKFDIYYVKYISFPLDLLILFKTFFHILRPQGINNSEGKIMPLFTGKTSS